jgi:DNA-binding CsgD family transcriptional regulator
MKKQSKTAQIRALLAQGLSVAQIAKKLKTSPSSVYQVRWRDEKNAKMAEIVEDMVGFWQEPVQEVAAVEAPVQNDLVNHPPHYKAGGIETIDFIEAKQLGYHLGNVVKYISRAQHKGGMEDLLKAQWYLNRAIEGGEVNA